MNEEMIRRIADIHNNLARMVANGIDLKSADNVILLGGAMNSLRVMIYEDEHEKAQDQNSQGQDACADT